MRRVRYLLVGLLSVVLAFAFWYRTRPVLVLLADGLFVQTEWAQGDHDLVLPLLVKGWRFKLVRVDRLPEEKEALHDLMDRQEADVLVLSPHLSTLAALWKVGQAPYRVSAITRKELAGPAFDVVLVEDFTQGYRQAAQREISYKLVSSIPVPEEIASLFPDREVVDGKGSEVYVQSRMDAWEREGVRNLIVYDVANLSLYEGMPMVVPAFGHLSLSPDWISGLIVSDFSSLVALATDYPETRVPLSLTLESRFRSAARMRGGYLAQVLASWKRKFL